MDRDNIESSYRDNKGRFAKGYKASDLPIEYRLKQAIAMSDAWRKSDKYIGDLKNKYPYLFNSWRSILYSEKGKRRVLAMSGRISEHLWKTSFLRTRKDWCSAEWIPVNLFLKPTLYGVRKKKQHYYKVICVGLNITEKY